MTKILLKKNINKVISKIEDENFLRAVYTILSNKAEEVSFALDDEMKKELDTRRENHKKGISKSYSWQSVKKSILTKNA